MIDKFTIVRKDWIRGGKDDKGSYLLREIDRKRCCLGFYLQACGALDTEMENEASPIHVYRIRRDDVVPDWLLGESQIEQDVKTNSVDCLYLMEINDAPDIDEPDREARVTKIFKDQGVEVTFV